MAADGTLSYAVTLANQGFLGPAGAVSGSIERMTGGLTRMLGPLAAAAAGAAGLAGGIAGIGKALGAAANMEQLSISFEVMLGSGEAAKKMLKEIEAMGAATPYEFPALAEGARTLLNFGVQADKILPTMKMLGDVAAGDANKMASLSLVFGQIASTGRLTGQDLLQLVNAGFNPLQEINRKTGESMADLKKRMEAGALSFAEVEAAFKSVTGEGGRFFGMMDKQSKTSLGLLSTLKDNIGQVFRTLGEPINDAIKPLLEGAIEMAKQFGETLKGIVGVVRGAIAEGKLGELIALALKVGLMEGANFGLGAIKFLAQASGKMLGFVFRQVFGEGGQLLLASLGQAPKMLAGLGMLIRSQLGEGFNAVVANFQAGLTWAVQQAMEAIGKIPGIGKAMGLKGFEAESFTDLLADFKEANSGENLQAEGERMLKESMTAMADAAKDLGPGIMADLGATFGDLAFEASDVFDAGPMKDALAQMAAELKPKETAEKVADAIKGAAPTAAQVNAATRPAEVAAAAAEATAESDGTGKKRPRGRVRLLGESVTAFWRAEQGERAAARGVEAKARQLAGGPAAGGKTEAAKQESKLLAILAQIEKHTAALDQLAVA